MDYPEAFKREPEEKRAEVVKNISDTLLGLNLVNYPNTAKALQVAYDRVALIKNIVRQHYATPELSFEIIIDNLEAATD